MKKLCEEDEAHNHLSASDEAKEHNNENEPGQESGSITGLRDVKVEDSLRHVFVDAIHLLSECIIDPHGFWAREIGDFHAAQMRGAKTETDKVEEVDTGEEKGEEDEELDKKGVEGVEGLALQVPSLQHPLLCLMAQYPVPINPDRPFLSRDHKEADNNDRNNKKDNDAGNGAYKSTSADTADIAVGESKTEGPEQGQDPLEEQKRQSWNWWHPLHWCVASNANEVREYGLCLEL